MRRPTSFHTLALAVVILVAAMLRLAELGRVPAGLYRDEAFYGLDAVHVLRGQHAIYFPANNGREPMFIYLLALSIGALGRTPFAVRLPAAIISLLTVPATFLMARELFGKRVGLLAAAVLAVTLWPVHLAHIGYRVGLLPLFAALTVWQAARAWTADRRPPTAVGSLRQPALGWIAAGALYGLCFYTYLAVRFTPLLVAAFIVYVWVTHPGERGKLVRAMLPFGVATAIVAMPLGVYALGHWDIFMGRGGQVTIFNPGIGGPNPWLTLAGNIVKAFGMFVWRGDFIARHNAPDRPVFDPVMSLAFLAGALIALGRIFRRRPDRTALVFALMWTVVMLIPTILAEDTPHFLRSVGVLPIVAVFPALGLEKFSMLNFQLPMVRGRILKIEHWYLIIVLFAISAAFTARDYFVSYAHDPSVRFWFDDAGAQMAAEINRFTGTGWTGDEWIAPDKAPAPGRRVFVDRGLWDGFVNAQFLAPNSSALTFLKAGSEAPAPSAGPTLLVLWPYKDWRRDLALAPRQSVIELRNGALSKGDRDKEPIVTYLTIRADPTTALPQPLARFQNGVQLIRAQIVGEQVRLTWYAPQTPDADYVVFVHALRDGALVAQHDGDPASGLYPMSQWRPGDRVIDEHPLPGAWDQAVIGLYRRDTGERAPVIDAAGNLTGDTVDIRK